MGSYPGIVSNSKISLDFGSPLEKQSLTNAAVYPAVMGSWEENVTLQGPCRQHQKLKYVRVGPFPMISGVIVKSWEKLWLESRLKTQHLYYYKNADIRLKAILKWNMSGFLDLQDTCLCTYIVNLGQIEAIVRGQWLIHDKLTVFF